MAVLDAEVPVEHRVWVQNSGSQQRHGQAAEGTYAEPITRYAYQVYPARWQRPTPDPINIEDLARTDINLLMDVPDATVYKNQDQVLINGTAFVVQGNPAFEDWGDGMQLMREYDDLIGGGQVLIRRVT
jgi:hypothetical protein